MYLEDAGFDWKILGPDVTEFDYVAWQCDQDAYAATGQKCSAQSILFQHSNWVGQGEHGSSHICSMPLDGASLQCEPWGKHGQL